MTSYVRIDFVGLICNPKKCQSELFAIAPISGSRLDLMSAKVKKEV